MTANGNFDRVPHLSQDDLATRIEAVALCRELFGDDRARRLWAKLLEEPHDPPAAPSSDKGQGYVALVRRFIDEACACEPTAEVQAAAIEAAYTSWAAARGEKRLSGSAIGRSLRALGFTSRKSSARIWTGLRVLEPGRDARDAADAPQI